MILIPADKFYTGTKEIDKFYILSNFCMLSGFGTIFGIVLLFLAVFNFRSKRLFVVVFIASFGSLVIGFITSQRLKNELKYGDLAEIGFSKIVAEDLRRVAEKVEKYKIKYGNYHDSLEQLKVI